MSVLLATYLVGLGYSPVQVGAVVTGTLLGSAALTLAVGLGGGRVHARTLLLVASVLMVFTGLGFSLVTAFWPLLAIAVVGTLNPSGGDVSVFLPTEQALLADETTVDDRPRWYAFYNLAGSFAAAFGALASGVVPDSSPAQRRTFLVYVAAAVIVAVIYRTLPRAGEVTVGAGPPRKLGPSKRTVFELAALFSFDSAASGFVVQSLLVLWLHLRFGLAKETTAALFFAAGLLGALSQLGAAPLARRIGLIRTMVFTHLPANAMLVGAAFAPSAPVAMALLLGRALFSQMDVPARQAFVMAVVRPEERAAAASVTNVPRSLASATTPLLAGVLLQSAWRGWPLVIAGGAKIVYDLSLLRLFSSVPAEPGAERLRPKA